MKITNEDRKTLRVLVGWQANECRTLAERLRVEGDHNGAYLARQEAARYSELYKRLEE